jgi:hypothetical protein
MAISRRKKLLREQQLKEAAVSRKREKMFETRVFREEFKPLVLKQMQRRDVPHYPSYHSSGHIGGTAKEVNKYSGEYLIGIATMHKSNLVPVGKDDDARNYATMRRN